MGHEPGSAPRRQPQQARGQARVEAILDAAEALYAEIGAEATTTNAIAARAAASVGSVYQFFPNKEAILAAAAARYQREMLAALGRLLPTAATLPLADLVEAFVGTLEIQGSQHIGVTRVVLQSPPGTPGGEAAAALRDAVADQLDELLALRLPQMQPAQRRRMALTALTALLALLALGITTKDSGSYAEMEALFHEARVLLTAYLQASVRASGD